MNQVACVCNHRSQQYIIYGNAPAYLQSLLPAKVGDTRPASRNSDHFTIIKARTETFKNSFIPSGIKLWNSSLNKIQDVNDVNYNSEPANTTFYEGQREVNIKHAQLRMKCSKLNAHLFTLHVIDSRDCSCGNNYEDSNHYLLHCPLFNTERQIMLHSLSCVVGIHNIDFKTLLFGSNAIKPDVNQLIFKPYKLRISFYILYKKINKFFFN